MKKGMAGVRQFQISVRSENMDSFRETVLSWREWRRTCAAGAAFFHIFSDGARDESVEEARAVIEEIMPDAACVGASASGCLFEGGVTNEELVVTCTVFEEPDSFARTRLFSIKDRDVDSFRRELREMVDSLEDVKGVEVVMTVDTIPVREVCGIIQEEIPPQIPVWGGGAFGDNSFTAFVFEKGMEKCTRGIVMTFLGGKNFHVMDSCVVGWKTLGAPMKVTRAEGKVLRELDGKPAFEVYNRYLKIPNDEHLFYNALEFPFAVNERDHILLRHALSCIPGGSLVMSTDIPEGSVLHMTYGDPETIMESVRLCVEKIGDFSPEAIAVFDCFGRKTFWGGTEATRETKPLHSLAPTYGFCTSGELIRWKERLDHLNLSLVVAAMREGGPAGRRRRDPFLEIDVNEHSMPLASRLANFINTATAELVEANRTLSVMAVTDRMTGLYNRGEIQRRITERLAQSLPYGGIDDPTSVVMIDLDDFKKINDTFGHQEGDRVLTAVSALVLESSERLAIGASCGRWGGEEIMILLPGMRIGDAADFAEELRAGVEGLVFPECGGATASFGVAQALPDELEDRMVSRADAALYRAKRAGKNCVFQADPQ